MVKKVIFSLVIFFVVASFFIFDYSLAQAQRIGIKISPVKIEELVDPGEVLRQKITVANQSATAETFYIYLKDFKSGDESGRPVLIAPGSEKGYFLASWIDISSEGFQFQPGEQKDIPFTINVPPEIGPGGYFGAIYFGTEPPQILVESEEKGAGMSVGQQAGALILLRVKGDVDERADVREFTVEKELYNTPFEVEFLTRIENLGNVHIKPAGNIRITNMLGRNVAEISMNDNGGNILPASIRRFSNTWKGDNGFGRYKAELQLTYGVKPELGGQGMQSLYGLAYFWIIPWKIIIPLLLGAIILISIFILLLKLYKNKAVQKAMEQAGLGQVRLVRKFQGPSPALHFSIILLVVFVVIFLIMMAIYFIFFA